MKKTVIPSETTNTSAEHVAIFICVKLDRTCCFVHVLVFTFNCAWAGDADSQKLLSNRSTYVLNTVHTQFSYESDCILQPKWLSIFRTYSWIEISWIIDICMAWGMHFTKLTLFCQLKAIMLAYIVKHSCKDTKNVYTIALICWNQKTTWET